MDVTGLRTLAGLERIAKTAGLEVKDDARRGLPVVLGLTEEPRVHPIGSDASRHAHDAPIIPPPTMRAFTSSPIAPPYTTGKREFHALHPRDGRRRSQPNSAN